MRALLADNRKLQKAMASHEHKIDQPYYGRPPIPPEAPAAGVRPLARRDASYALLCHAFRALTLALIAVGVVALVLWLVYQPSSLKAYVDSAQLTRFDLDNSGTQTHQLRYNLTVGVSIRNPNRKQAVLYRRLDAVALYGGEWLGYVDFPRARQERRSTMEVRPSFRGQAALAGGGAVRQGEGRGVLQHQRQAPHEGAAEGGRRGQRRVQAGRGLLREGSRPGQRHGSGAGVHDDAVPCRRLLVTERAETARNKFDVTWTN